MRLTSGMLISQLAQKAQQLFRPSVTPAFQQRDSYAPRKQEKMARTTTMSPPPLSTTGPDADASTPSLLRICAPSVYHHRSFAAHRHCKCTRKLVIDMLRPPFRQEEEDGARISGR